MTWHRPARLGVALFGIGVAAAVYWAAGERPATRTPQQIERLDPDAVIESAGARLQQERGVERDFEVTSERQLYYEDGSSALYNVSIVVRGRAGRDFVLAGKEARAAGNQSDLRITGSVTLTASDGLTVNATEATFNQARAIVEAPGAITFSKGRMRGSAQGMTYDEAGDILTLIDQVGITVVDDDPAGSLDLKAGGAVLRRLEHVLDLDRQVHALRGGQVIDADRATARLSEPDNQVNFLELRGHARVSGGSGALDAMTAQDIDLDYTDDGRVLERVRLAGDGALLMRPAGGRDGRQLTAANIDVALAPDGAVTTVQGRENVRFSLPADDDAPVRTITARSLDGVGAPGRGLTSARFAGAVEYREDAPRTARDRSATAETLVLGFEDDAVHDAVFTGRSRFRDNGLDATAAEARYRPDRGTLRLTGADAGGPPHVTDDRIDVIADEIDLTLTGRRLNATRSVKTTLRPEPTRGASRGGRGGDLIQDDRPAFVNAAALQYRGDEDTAVYDGGATLWQGETSIRATRITLDRARGDLVATGDARANIDIESGATTGRAEEIRYTRDDRAIVYTGMARPGTSPAGGRAQTPARAGAPPPPPAVRQAQLTGPQGDLRADRIAVTLADDGGGVERLEAFVEVHARVDTRTATGGRLSYVTAEERYTMWGDASAAMVKVVDACRTTTGRTLVFFKSSERILVDGNDLGRTQTTSTGNCSAGDQ